jgi:hypothetical protein
MQTGVGVLNPSAETVLGGAASATTTAHTECHTAAITSYDVSSLRGCPAFLPHSAAFPLPTQRGGVPSGCAWPWHEALQALHVTSFALALMLHCLPRNTEYDRWHTRLHQHTFQVGVPFAELCCLVLLAVPFCMLLVVPYSYYHSTIQLPYQRLVSSRPVCPTLCRVGLQ